LQALASLAHIGNDGSNPLATLKAVEFERARPPLYPLHSDTTSMFAHSIEFSETPLRYPTVLPFPEALELSPGRLYNLYGVMHHSKLGSGALHWTFFRTRGVDVVHFDSISGSTVAVYRNKTIFEIASTIRPPPVAAVYHRCTAASLPQLNTSAAPLPPLPLWTALQLFAALHPEQVNIYGESDFNQTARYEKNVPILVLAGQDVSVCVVDDSGNANLRCLPSAQHAFDVDPTPSVRARAESDFLRRIGASSLKRLFDFEIALPLPPEFQGAVERWRSTGAVQNSAAVLSPL